MAMIECEECGQMVSDKATTCPHCGAPVEKEITCPDCGTVIPRGAIVCPDCGCPKEQAPDTNGIFYKVFAFIAMIVSIALILVVVVVDISNASSVHAQQSADISDIIVNSIYNQINNAVSPTDKWHEPMLLVHMLLFSIYCALISLVSFLIYRHKNNK